MPFFRAYKDTFYGFRRAVRWHAVLAIHFSARHRGGIWEHLADKVLVMMKTMKVGLLEEK